MDSDMTMDRHFSGADRAAALAADARAGLASAPRSIPPKWFYDAEGSRLFDEVTRLPEYYPTRRERAILIAQAARIAERSKADTIVELGSGTSEKTRILLSALAAAGTLRRFVPFDVDESVLLDAGRSLSAEFPDIEIHGVVGDFERHLGLLPTGGRRLILFLGGTIGNLRPEQRHRFFSDLRAGMSEDDTLLLGTDLVKDPARIERAYDDSAGVGVRFNRNMLHVLNAALDGNFVPDNFTHVARWNADAEWLEVRLRSNCDQAVRLAAIDLEFDLAAGEEIHNQISAKFRRAGVAEELDRAGHELIEWWTDPAGDYALSLSRPAFS